MKRDTRHKRQDQKNEGRVFCGRKGPGGMSLNHGVLGGNLKYMKVDKIHKIHDQKIQGGVFSRKTKLRDEPRPRGAWRDPKIDEHSHNPQDPCP